MRKYIFYGLTLVLWILAIVMWVNGKLVWLFPFLLGLHFSELVLIGYKTGKKYGASNSNIIIMCMLYGIFWWGYLRKEMAEDDLSESDFIEDGLEPWREVVDR